MQYVALLRGINIGGNNLIQMSRLATLFRELGFTNVRTYINSGNVLFESLEADTRQMTEQVESSIERTFGFSIKVLVVSEEVIHGVVASTPDAWVNDRQHMKCDVLFLWSELDNRSALERLTIREVDEVHYVPGALIWRVWLKDYGQSGMNKLAGSKEYKLMTVRNINTVKRLAAMLRPESVAPPSA